jgi:predicted nucleic acid-binding protein
LPAEYFLDSNVFVNAKIRDRRYGSSCASIITDLAEGRFSGATSSLALVEVSNALRRIGMAREVADEVNAIYSTGVAVNELLNVDVRLMVELFKLSGISPYDCAHAAIMKRIGLNTIVSTDPHFESIPGINRLDPVKYARRGSQARGFR